MTLVADWSDGDDEVTKMLDALGDKQLPVIAIFPADDPYRPTKLTGLYSKGDLLQAIRGAGASASSADRSDTKFVSQSP